MTQPTPATAAAPKGLTTTRTNGAPRDPGSEFRDVLTKMRPQIIAALPKHIDPDRLLRIVLTTVRKTPALLQCSRESVLAGIMQAAQLGLEPDSNLGLAYLLPYGNQCQLIVGWKGLIELARRSGLVANVTAHCVHYGDFFEYELGLDTKLRHIPADVLDMPQYAREREIADGMRGEQVVSVLAGARKSDLIAAYAVVTMKDGSKNFRVVTAKFVQKIRAQSKSGNHPSSPWVAWEDQMWEKTAVKQALRFVPLSPEDKTVIEHAGSDEGRMLSGIADVRTREALAAEPLSFDSDGVVTNDEPPVSGTDPAPQTQGQEADGVPAAAKRGRPRKAAAMTTAPEDAISGAPPAAQAQAQQGSAPRPPSAPVAPPPGPMPPEAQAAPRQAGLFGDEESDDPGPGPDGLDKV